MTTKKPASKSEAKRVTLQKTNATVAERTLLAKIEHLEERLDKIQANQKVLIDAQQFIADESRPIYGLGGLGVIFDAVARKFK